MKSSFLRFLSLILLFSLLTGLLGGCMTPPISDGAGNTQASSSNVTSEDFTQPEGSSFAIHFIDVGQADAALVLCDGKSMLIDGGNRDDGDLIHTYLKKMGLTYLDYVVGTHADEDHIGGLAAALTYADAGAVWCPVKSYSTKAFENFAAKAQARGKELIMPAIDSTVQLGSATVTVLAPRKQYSDNNNRSIVLRIVYGETSFLFTGDAERNSEADLLESGVDLSATVLKVGHHGAETSTTYPFLREIMPQYAVISVGKDNSYGHPTEDALSRLRDAGVAVYRTDLHGDIICKSNGKTVRFETGKNSSDVLPPVTSEGGKDTSATEYAYIGNVSSKKFHLPTCTTLPSEDNRIYFITREEAVAAGYVACGRCKP